jgi:MtN3 and saliva related transmembrane protein
MGFAGLRFDVAGRNADKGKPAPGTIVPVIWEPCLAHDWNESPCVRVVADTSSGDGTTEEMQFLETVVGATAALLSSLSYIPQVKKVWSGQPTDDLSSRTLIALTSGLVLWVVYGAIKADWIIVVANLVGASLTGFVLYHKLRERDRSRGQVAPDRA